MRWRELLGGDTGSGRPVTVPDAVLAAALAVFVVVGTATFPRLGDERPLDWLGIALLLVAALALVGRRRAPVVVVAVTVGSALAYYVSLYPGIFADTPAVIAGYTLAAAGRRRAAVVAGVALCVGTVAIGLVPGRDLAGAATGALWVSGFWAAFVVAGQVSYQRAAYLRAVEERVAEAERTRQEAVRRRGAEERLRIARELHDSLTHTLSVITVQAGVSAHLADKDSDQVRVALGTIADAGRNGMRELRATLGVLRESSAGTPADVDGAPVLADLPALFARVEAAGTPVRVRDNVVGAVPRHVEEAVYRIVQESLTNASRHAPGAPATVQLDQEEGSLVVRIDNDPVDRGTDHEHATASGLGTDGIRRRAAALGGRVNAARRADGGYSVHAHLPMRV